MLKELLRITVPPRRALAFWCLDFNSNDEVMCKCSALSGYAAYTAFNVYRTKGVIANSERAADAMKQAIHQAAMGKNGLGKFLDCRWQSPIREY